MSFKLRNFVTKLHLKTSRNYVERMKNKKVFCMKIARKYSEDYWDGKRSYGYGGYKFIDSYWKPVAINLIKTYKLKENSKILDVGCGKGYLLYEIKKLLPKIKVFGFDISSYAIKNSKKEIKKNLVVRNINKKFPFKKKYFDLCISLGVLHNLQIQQIAHSIKEINRVSKNQYVMVESYRNEQELFNLQCWALTCESFFKPIEWEYIFKKYGFKGDFEFIYFK